jgi:predicted component of type VI protein secretion system
MALKVVVSKSGSTQPVSEHIFGKEARARGISVGADSANDIVIDGVPARAGRIERRQGGYYYTDFGGGVGYTADGQLKEAGSSQQVTEGTRIGVGGFTLAFLRGETPRREPVVETAPNAPAATDLQSAAYQLVSDVSRHFLGEGNFQSIEEVERFGALMKLTLEVAMEWMGRSLKGREEFKDQFSAPLTQIFARSLNPVKKGQDITQIANFLLDWREERDLDEIKGSLQHTFQDMARHQMGLLAGVQQFVSDLQQKLDPVQIEKAAGTGIFGGAKKAWERYAELYGETFAESSKLFNELIYPSIRKGYIFSHEDIQSNDKQGNG